MDVDATGDAPARGVHRILFLQTLVLRMLPFLTAYADTLLASRLVSLPSRMAENSFCLESSLLLCRCLLHSLRCADPIRHAGLLAQPIPCVYVASGGSKSLDLESQFAAGMLGSHASLTSNGEDLSPVVHANGGLSPALNGLSSAPLAGAAMRLPPPFAVDNHGRPSPVQPYPPPPPLLSSASAATLSASLSVGADLQHAGGGAPNGGLDAQRSVNGPVQLDRSPPVSADFFEGLPADLDDGISSWSAPDYAFEVSFQRSQTATKRFTSIGHAHRIRACEHSCNRCQKCCLSGYARLSR